MNASGGTTITADGRRIISFDTSAINQLADDPDGDALIAGLTAGYFVRFPFTTISEIIATSKGERRAQLLRVGRRLLASGDCIEPHHEMMRVMVARFEKSLPLGLQHVYLRMNEAEDEVRRARNFDDELAGQEREDNRLNDRTFRAVYDQARAAFDEVTAKAEANGRRMPGSVGELLEALQKGGAFWVIARNLYERMATRPADDTEIKLFYNKCEPFRALMVAIVAAQYDRCIRPPTDGRSLKAGRNDTFMATCLPYCDEFITNDSGQLACYEEVVRVAGLHTTIRSFDDFKKSLFLGTQRDA